MRDNHMVDAELRAFLAREARVRDFVGPLGVPSRDSPLRATVNEQTADLSPCVSVGHSFVKESENAERQNRRG